MMRNKESLRLGYGQAVQNCHLVRGIAFCPITLWYTAFNTFYLSAKLRIPTFALDVCVCLLWFVGRETEILHGKGREGLRFKPEEGGRKGGDSRDNNSPHL